MLWSTWRRSFRLPSSWPLYKHNRQPYTIDMRVFVPSTIDNSWYYVTCRSLNRSTGLCGWCGIDVGVRTLCAVPEFWSTISSQAVNGNQPLLLVSIRNLYVHCHMTIMVISDSFRTNELPHPYWHGVSNILRGWTADSEGFEASFGYLIGIRTNPSLCYRYTRGHCRSRLPARN